MALVHLSTVEEDMDAEFETIDARLQSFISQFHSEVGVLDRIIHKYKNQHRRSSYFQYLLKVRRDCKLLQTTNLVELVNSSFLVINGNRPKQKLQLLERWPTVVAVVDGGGMKKKMKMGKKIKSVT
ncbi:zinc finger, CCHC-type containing protein [Tanacetum coccineum]